jgi:hypothetical protein
LDQEREYDMMESGSQEGAGLCDIPGLCLLSHRHMPEFLHDQKCTRPKTNRFLDWCELQTIIIKGEMNGY